MTHHPDRGATLQAGRQALLFLQSLQHLTQRAHAALERGDWDAALAAQEQRTELIEASGDAFERFVNTSATAEADAEVQAQRAAVRAAAEHLHRGQAELAARFADCQAEILRQIDRVDQGGRATHAYRVAAPHHSLDLRR